MATVLYTILLIGIVLLPIPLWSFLEYRARKKALRQGFAVLEATAGRHQLRLSARSESCTGWLAADPDRKVLVLVTEGEEGWQSRLIEVKAGCSCQLSPGDSGTPLSLSLRIHPPGEQPAEWLLYEHNRHNPRSWREAEKTGEQWCATIRHMISPAGWK